MKQKWTTALLAICFAASGSLVSLKAQQTPPDNTKVNQRDRAAGEPTADQGKNNASDLDLMKKIRKSIAGDKSLSSYAHNVKVISQNGQVTLKGVVRSEDEKRAVAQKASDIAGAGNVTDELTIKPKKSS